MSPRRRPTDRAASARSRLHDLARKQNVELQLLLSEFAVERLLYRLGVSPHANDYVLKGAMLFRLWSADRGRATWDLDLLGREARREGDVASVVRDLCAIACDDGIVFDSASIRSEEIRTADEFAGVRVRLVADLAGARIPMQVDVAFGDAVSPEPVREDYPTLLDHAPPSVWVYPREAVVAEKLEAMISLGVTNSRMKDFYDVQVLSSSFAFEGPALAEAVRATFERRGTPIPTDTPLVLTPEFLGAGERRTQWRAFLRRGRLPGPPDAAELAGSLRSFLCPVLAAVARREVFAASWPAGGPWEVKPSGLGPEPDS